MSVKKEDIKNLNLKQISEMKLLLDQQEQTIKQDEIDSLIEETKILADDMGLEFSDIFKVIVKKPKIVYPPVFRNPENPKNTWSGVGAPAKWVKEWIVANSEDLTPLLIDKSQAKPDKKYLDDKQKKSVEAFKNKDKDKSDGSPAKQKQTNPIKQKA